jgi:hypothetical protein
MPKSRASSATRPDVTNSRGLPESHFVFAVIAMLIPTAEDFPRRASHATPQPDGTRF